MRKSITALIAIGVATILTGCGMAETPSSPTTEETTTAENQIEVTTTSPEEETTTSEPQDESNYDNERIKVTKWDMNKIGTRIPIKIVVDDVTYEYIYNEYLLFQGINGSDGTSIELNICDEYDEEKKNGRIVKYFVSDEMAPGELYDGFEYEGKKYTYQYNDMLFISGVLDSDNNIVAEYKYILGSKGDRIEVINHTEDNLGEVNSVRYRGQYYDEITGFIFWGSEVYNMVNGKMQTLKG